MKCKAVKKDGNPCTLQAQGPDGLCWAHSKKHAEARRKGAARGGRNKPSGDLAILKQKLVQLGDDVMAGSVVRADASVAAQCYGVAIKALEAAVRVRELEESKLVETALKIEEQREITKRLEELEDRLMEKRHQSEPWVG